MSFEKIRLRLVSFLFLVFVATGVHASIFSDDLDGDGKYDDRKKAVNDKEIGFLARGTGRLNCSDDKPRQERFRTSVTANVVRKDGKTYLLTVAHALRDYEDVTRRVTHCIFREKFSQHELRIEASRFLAGNFSRYATDPTGDWAIAELTRSEYEPIKYFHKLIVIERNDIPNFYKYGVRFHLFGKKIGERDIYVIKNCRFFSGVESNLVGGKFTVVHNCDMNGGFSGGPIVMEIPIHSKNKSEFYLVGINTAEWMSSHYAEKFNIDPIDFNFTNTPFHIQHNVNVGLLLDNSIPW